MAQSPSLIGRYQILGVVGRGGMGAVYRAFDPGIKRHVAIKAINKSMLDEAELAHVMARFRHEAQTLWNNDAAHSIVDLGVFPGDWSSLAHGINDLCQVVGSSQPPFGSRPVVWNNDAAHTPYALPVLPGDNYGRAIAVNNIGQAIGTSCYGTPGTWNATPERTVAWRDGGAVYELQSLLDPASGAGVPSVVPPRSTTRVRSPPRGTRGGQARVLLLTPVN